MKQEAQFRKIAIYSPNERHIGKVFHQHLERLGGVMVSVLASSAEGRGFDPRPGQTEIIKIGICCFSAKHAEFRSNSKDWKDQS